MAKTRNINVDILLGLKGKGIDEAVKDVQKLGKNIQSLSGSAIKAAAAFVAFKGARQLGEFAKESVTQAQSLERGLAALGTIFGEQSDEMLDFAKSASEIGLSMTEAAKASTFLGSVLKQSGFDIETTAQLTQRLVRLANDLAITYQYDVQEALLAMTALFRGEYDPIEKFGVAMKQNEIEGVKLARGLDKLTGRAEIFADQQIRLELLFQRATDAEGAYARQSETLFVRQQQLAAVFKNVQATVGLALTPSLEKLTYAMIPVVESLTPVLIQLFNTLIPVVEKLTADKDRLIAVLLGGIQAFGVLIELVAKLTIHLIENIGFYKNMLIAFGALVVGIKIFGGLIVAIQGAQTAAKLLNITLGLTARKLKILKIAIAGTGFGLIALGVGWVAEKVMGMTDGLEDLDTELDSINEIDLEALMDEMAGATNITQDFTDTAGAAAGAAGELKDAVGDFYRGLADSAAKQSAKMQLQAMGASEGLINAVLGSGEEWYKVFAEVTRNGLESLQEVQAMFMQTQEGFDEAMSKWQEEFDAFEAFKKSALEAKDALVEFVTEFKILPTIERQLGRFEQAAADQLASIEEKLTEAFDNGYILQESYRNLQTYARQEFAVLRQIERQRDEILARRDAAAALIQSVSDSVRSGAQLVNVLQNVQNETEKVDVASVVKKTIQDSKGLREFEVIVTSAIVEPIKEVTSQSQKLVAGYRDIVERTRAFVQNMKALRALGLDPQLFNQLVEAGVDAGGATAEALIEGGIDTVNEVNNLFDELNALGEELGEETAQVMYGQGENFVDGIVKGLEAQAQSLEDQAKALAETFTTTFEDILISGIEAAIAAAEAALARMPRFEGQPVISGPSGPSGPGGPSGPSGPSTPIVTPLKPGYTPPLSTQMISAAQSAAARAQEQARAQNLLTAQRNIAAANARAAQDRTTVAGTTVNINANRIDSRSLASTLSKLYSSGATPTSRTFSYLGR